MNELEDKLVKILKKLKDKFGVVEVKAEFEAEASRVHEVMRLKDIAQHAGLGLVLKIGGPEAITDIFTVQQIGVTGLVAPMIESAYALKKYLSAVKNYVKPDLRKNMCIGVNLETYQSFINLEEILKIPEIRILDKVTLGRIDMIGSLGLTRNEVNADKIYQIAESMFTRCKKKHLITAMGGGIDETASEFISKLLKKHLLDYYETRKIVFATNKKISNMKEGIILANRFELMWLQNKKNYYTTIYHEDDLRINMLKKRVKLPLS